MRVENAKIWSTKLEIEDRTGSLSAWVFVNRSYGTQGFGGFALYRKDTDDINAAGMFINGVLKAADVTEWGDLPKQSVRIRVDDQDMIVAIGHIIRDDLWFCPEEAFAAAAASRRSTV